MVLAFLFDSVGFGEWVVLLAVILVVVGPKRLPETARKFGQYYAKFRRAAETFKHPMLDLDSGFGQAVNDLDRTASDIQKSIAEADAQWSAGEAGYPPEPAPAASTQPPAQTASMRADASPAAQPTPTELPAHGTDTPQQS